MVLYRIVSVALLALAALITPAYADIRVRCFDGTQPTQPVLIADYRGAASGTLHIDAPFGTISVPARWQETVGLVEDRQLPISSIVATGQVEALMPQLAALEACILSKRLAVDGDDPDVDGMLAQVCAPIVPQASTPVEVNAEFAVVDGALAGFLLDRRFLTAGRLGGRPLSINLPASPEMVCSLDP